jgi:hypothetical protein
MSIIGILNEINEDQVVMPAIQRDFVWPEEKILRLLDSIMRGYPIGIVLLWETYNDIQYRPFQRDFRPGVLFTYRDNATNKKLRLVLDGQQRLQSLFIALYGSIEGKYLYFDVLSGRNHENLSDERFIFSFLRPQEADKANKETEETVLVDQEDRPEGFLPQCFIKAADLFKMGAQEQEEFKTSLAAKLLLPDGDKIRLSLNLTTYFKSLTADENIMKVSTIDENLTSASPFRKSEEDVLEVFVRINREGTPLSRSDLIFSMLKLNWKESAEDLPKFVQDVNRGNSFNIDNDFVIRCLFAVSDLGTKFNLDLLRKAGNMKRLQDNFSECCMAIRSTIDFVFNAGFASSRVIGGRENVIPIVYYLFFAPKHQVPDSQLDAVRKSLLLFGFTRPFSRYADSRLGKFIREELVSLAKGGDFSFPFESAVWWVGYWERIKDYGDELLQANPLLTLHIVQGLAGGETQYVANAPQIDHIFPRSILREKGFDEALINHYANFWILAKGKNQNKSNKHPREYFADVSKTEMQRALIDSGYFDYRRYTTFIEDRSRKMQERITRRFGLSERDFQSDENEE